MSPMVYTASMFEVRRTDAFDGWLKGLKDSKGRTKIQGSYRPVGQWQPWRCRPGWRGLERAAHRFLPRLPCVLRASRQDALLAAMRRQGQPERGHQERARDVERIEPTGQKAGQ